MLTGWRTLAVCLAFLSFALSSSGSDRAVVSGLVVDSKGAPIEGATVRALELEASGEDRPALGEATSTATGAFELRPLGADRVRLEVVHPDFLPHGLPSTRAGRRPGSCVSY